MYKHTKDESNRYNEVLKTITKTLTFVDADAKINADTNAAASTAGADADNRSLALCERCSGKLKTCSNF